MLENQDAEGTFSVMFAVIFSVLLWFKTSFDSSKVMINDNDNVKQSNWKISIDAKYFLF